MKILYFYQYFTVPRGSYSTRVYELTRRWVKAGDQVTVITSVYDKSGLTPAGWIDHMSIEGVDVRVINIRLSQKHGIATRLVSFAAYSLISCWYALFMPADVVVCSSGPLTVGVPGLVARLLRRRPMVFEVRDLWPEGAIQLGILRNRWMIATARDLEKLCYRTASRVVALSEGMADFIRSRHGLDNIEVVPNASDNELFDAADGRLPPEEDNGKARIVYAGSLGLIDDCRQVVELANCLQRRERNDVEVVVIGDGNERAAIETYAQDLRLTNIRFLGPRPKTEVAVWLKNAAAGLFVVREVPFLATASPNKLFDAFAAGLPIIQTSQGWIKDLIDSEECGITVPEGDAESMADAVLLLIDNPSRRKTLSTNAKRVALTLFDRTLLATKMRHILYEAAGNQECQCHPEAMDASRSKYAPVPGVEAGQKQ